MTLNHRQIEAFRAAMQLGSASAAAEAMHVTQPAVSRLIADLERRVGFALFERRRRGLHPTGDGALLYEEVERSFRGLELIAETAEAIRTKQSGRVRVIAMPAYGDGFLSTLIGRFVARRPGIRVELETAPKSAIVGPLITEQFDLGIATLPLPETGLEVRALTHQEACCICPARHPLAAGGPLSLAALAEQPLVLLAQGSPFRTAVEQLFEQAGLTPRIAAEARTQRAICNMVAAGAGLAILDPGVARDHGAGALAVVELETSLNWALAAITPQRRAPSQATQALLAELIAHFK
ncbi:MAG: LysR substrate-binding domain-containing protein [Pseudomonadota bacterium]